MFPVEKYKYFVNEKKHDVIAVSTYAGKTVKGVAKCDPRDEFDIQKGKDLAAARCAEKIANKRVARATKKVAEAEAQLIAAQKHFKRMNEYLSDSKEEAKDALIRILQIKSMF